MTRAMFFAAILGAMTGLSFDAAPLVQYCSDAEEAKPWWDGLGLSSVWPMDEGSGNVLNDRVGSFNGRWIGSSVRWRDVGGLMCLDFGADSEAYGRGAAFVGDVYDIRTNSLLYGCWIRPKWKPTSYSIQCVFGKGSSSLVAGNYRVYYFVDFSHSVNLNGQSISGSIPGSVPAMEWTHFVASISRPDKTVSVWTNGALARRWTYTVANSDLNNAEIFCLFQGVSYTNSDHKANGSTRDFFVKVDGTTNEIPAIFNATRAIYGK